MIGTTLGGRYRLEAVLGRGGMATVYAAQDVALARTVAVKVLNEALSADPDLVRRFDQEARAAARLNHPNIVAVFDVSEADETHYFVMEYVEGDDLKALIERDAPFSSLRIASLGAQLADALSFAHGRGVVHRDVKPQNILVDASDHLKLADFGVARAPGTPQLTGAGFVLGTAQYMAPEQARGEEAGPAADVYAIGVVLFEMATGRVPYEGSSPLAIALQHERGLTDAAWQGSAVPAAIRTVIDRAMSVDPRDRFPSAADLRRALDQVTRFASAQTAQVPVSPRSSSVGSRLEPSAPPVPRPSAPGGRDAPGRSAVSWPAILIVGLLLFGVAALVPFALGSNLDRTGRTLVVDPPVSTAVPVAQPSAVPSPGTPTPSPAPVPVGEPAQTAVVEPTAPPAPQPTLAATSAPTAVPSPTIAGVIVPELIGQPLPAVQDALQRLGLSSAIRRVPDSAPPETVIGQDPGPGSRVEPGSKVGLLVSRGKQLSVPDLVGERIQDVGNDLETMGFRLQVRERRSQRPNGTILEQSPDAGAIVPAGSELQLTVAR